MFQVTDERAWDKVFDTNLKSHFFLIKEALPHLPQGSSILFVSSIGGFQPNPMGGAYSISKTALLGLTKSLSKELAPKQIRVNCIAPGVIKTRFSEALWKDPRNVKLLEEIPLNRFGETSECGGISAFLLSHDASYITGESIVVAGGAPSRL